MVGSFLRRRLSRTKEEKDHHHPIIQAVSKLTEPVELKTAKKAFTDLKSPKHGHEKKAAALELINQFLMEQPTIGERYYHWKHAFKGLQSIIDTIENPPEGSLLFDQIQYFHKLIEADESIMEALTRHAPSVGTFGTKNVHEFDDIMLLAKELLVFKPESSLRRQGSINRSNSNLQRKGSIRQSDSCLQTPTVIRRSNSDSRCRSTATSSITSLDSETEVEHEQLQEEEELNNNEVSQVFVTAPTTPLGYFSTRAPSPLYRCSAVPPPPSTDSSNASTTDDENEQEEEVSPQPEIAAPPLPLPVTLPFKFLDSIIEVENEEEQEEEVNNNEVSNAFVTPPTTPLRRFSTPALPPLPGCSSIPPPPPLPSTPGAPPPPPGLFDNTMTPPPRGSSAPLFGNGMTPPPPPPPTGGFNFLTCGFKKPESKKCIKYKKDIQTVPCRWTALNDNDAKDTIFEKIESKRLTNEDIDEIGFLFTKRPPNSCRPSLGQRSIKEVAFNSVNDKKKLAIELLFKKLRMTVPDLIETVTTSLNPDVSKDILESLLKSFPTENELEPYKNLMSCSDFGDADLFCFHVSRQSGFKFLIELIVAKQELEADMQRSHGSINIIQTAFESIARVYPQLKMLCEKVWQIGNYLNQNTNNYGAAGFEFSDLVRVLSITTEDSLIKLSVMDVIAEKFGPLKSEFFEISNLKTVISEASKPVLDEITGIIDMAARKVKDLEDRLEEIEINENMKDPAKNDLHMITSLINEQREAVEKLNDTKMKVFRYLVVKKMSIGEFFDYFKTIITTIDNAYEKQSSSEIFRNDSFRHSMMETPTASPFQKDLSHRQSYRPIPQTSTSSELPNLKEYLQKRRSFLS
uniref:FH2 domain-containing protein n=1 Tax=Panagrolaimus sp. ES5 TaxID=591445 RepID=A0AC34GRI5_9BILA